MANLAKTIREHLDKSGETFEAMTIGHFYEQDQSKTSDWDKWVAPETGAANVRAVFPHIGKVLSDPSMISLLDFEYDDGFGGARCHPVHVWTDKSVGIHVTYDGSTWMEWVPRNPSPDIPGFYGGG